MTQFFQTQMGRQYYEYQLPELTRQLTRIADQMEKGKQLPFIMEMMEFKAPHSVANPNRTIPAAVEKEINDMSELQAAELIQKLVPEVQIVPKEHPLTNEGHNDSMREEKDATIPPVLKMRRLEICKANEPDYYMDFTEPSNIHGPVVAIYGIQITDKGPTDYLISEHKNGKFWTIAEQEDIIGTLSECIQFLITKYQ